MRMRPYQCQQGPYDSQMIASTLENVRAVRWPNNADGIFKKRNQLLKKLELRREGEGGTLSALTGCSATTNECNTLSTRVVTIRIPSAPTGLEGERTTWRTRRTSSASLWKGPRWRRRDHRQFFATASYRVPASTLSDSRRRQRGGRE